MVIMVLTPQEESLVGLIRSLPPVEAAKVFDWALRLADLAGGSPIEWSDAWTEEDLVDATRAALQDFESREREER